MSLKRQRLSTINDTFLRISRDHVLWPHLLFLNFFVARWQNCPALRRMDSHRQGKIMPRKKNAAQEAADDQTSAAAAVAEPEKAATPTRPAYIDGPPVDEKGNIIKPNNPETKNWGDPYKAIVSTPTFEMGENRRFKQRVFIFKEKPSEDVLASLKENGFTYRANEKAWTIQANPDTRRLSEELAEQFAGQFQSMRR
ncbi:MAG: hypothetical protein ABSB74_06355 [Tepidisphaeraceae bacterium]